MKRVEKQTTKKIQEIKTRSFKQFTLKLMFSFLKKILSSKTFDLGRGHAFSSLFLCLSSIGRKKKSLLHTNIFTSNHTRASWRWIWTASNIRTQLSKQISVTMQSKKMKVGIDELRDEKEKERSWKNDPFPVCFSAPRLRRLITHTKTNDIQNATKRVAEDRWFFFYNSLGGREWLYR